MLRALCLLPLLLLTGCCHYLCRNGLDSSRSVTRFFAADAPPVDSGPYPGPFNILSADNPLSAETTPLLTDVEAHAQVLPRLVRERISVKSPLEFRLMYVGQDSLNHRLILRYFSRAAIQTEIAGWQVQLVYSLPSLRPEHAYVQAVPLE